MPSLKGTSDCWVSRGRPGIADLKRLDVAFERKRIPQCEMKECITGYFFAADSWSFGCFLLCGVIPISIKENHYTCRNPDNEAIQRLSPEVHSFLSSVYSDSRTLARFPDLLEAILEWGEFEQKHR